MVEDKCFKWIVAILLFLANSHYKVLKNTKAQQKSIYAIYGILLAGRIPNICWSENVMGITEICLYWLMLFIWIVQITFLNIFIAFSIFLACLSYLTDTNSKSVISNSVLAIRFWGRWDSNSTTHLIFCVLKLWI